MAVKYKVVEITQRTAAFRNYSPGLSSFEQTGKEM